MAATGRLNVSEGVVVLFAALVMTSSLCSLMAWHAVRQGASQGGAGQPSGELAEVVASLEQGRANVEAKLSAAEADQRRFREERDALQARLQESETRRLETKARAELDLDTAQAAQQRFAEKSAELDRRIEGLVNRNAELQAELDVASAAAAGDMAPEAERIVPDRPAAAEVFGRLLDGGARVLDANESLQYVVFDAGSESGVRPGMRFHVLVDDQVVARLRAVDVRENLTGASVDEAVAGPFPKTDDRVVVGMNADN